MNMCKYCCSEDLEIREVPPHVGLYCTDCGKFQKWVKREPKPVEQEPATAAQQKYALSLMTRWKHSGKVMTAKQAGAIIQAFKE